MDSILHDLYHGKLFPSEQYTPPEGKHRKFQEECADRYDNFVKSLEPYQKNAFVRIIDDQFHLMSFDHPDVFACGFQMGAKVMFEVYREEIMGVKR